MVFCIVAMVVFGFLGIFSAKYRTYAREAFRCFARLATLRPCNTAFDEQMKAKITAKLLTRSPRIAHFTFVHFGAISLVFAIAMFASLGYTAYSVYNLVAFGTCDPAHPDQCVFNPENPNAVTCPFENLTPASGIVTINGYKNIESATVQNINGKPLVYFFGTTWCPHCGWERPLFINATSNFGDWTGIHESDLSNATFTSKYITVKAYEIDKVQPPAADIKVFQHYSPDGRIPLLIFGGKYFRVGSGEAFGAENETAALNAMLCKITDSPANVSACNSTNVQEMMAQL